VVVVEEAGTTARGGLWRSEVGEVEEIMDELVMAFGGRFESETIGAVVENPVSWKSSFPGPNPVRFRLRSRKAAKHMSAMSATPPPTAPPIMALVGALLREEVFLFHDLVLCSGFGRNRVMLTLCSSLKNLVSNSENCLVSNSKKRPAVK
jgi:hypothetical protein